MCDRNFPRYLRRNSCLEGFQDWRPKPVQFVGLYLATILVISGAALACSPKLTNGSERKAGDRGATPSAIEIEALAGYQRSTPKLLAREMPLRLTSKIPCAKQIESYVLVDERGLPIGVKLEKGDRRFALCEDAVISYLLKLSFSPARISNRTIVSWAKVAIDIDSPASFDGVIGEKSVSPESSIGDFQNGLNRARTGVVLNSLAFQETYDEPM